MANDSGGKSCCLSRLVSVDQLANEAGVSSRQLERRFLREVGVGPKLLGRIIRFQQVFRAVEHRNAAWAEVAVECGYYDQAHLIRDFNQFAQQTPAVLFSSQSALTEAFTRKARKVGILQYDWEASWVESDKTSRAKAQRRKGAKEDAREKENACDYLDVCIVEFGSESHTRGHFVDHPATGKQRRVEDEGFAATPDFVIDVGDDGFGFLHPDAFQRASPPMSAPPRPPSCATPRSRRWPSSPSPSPRRRGTTRPSWAVFGHPGQGVRPGDAAATWQNAPARTITTIEGSHAPSTSPRPRTVADVIMSAAEKSSLTPTRRRWWRVEVVQHALVDVHARHWAARRNSSTRRLA